MTAYGQPVNAGTINVDRADYVYHLKRSDSLQWYKQLVAAKQKDIDTLLARISTIKSEVIIMEEKDRLTVEGYTLQIKSLLEEKALYESQIKTYEKLLRREKRKRFWTSVAGTLTTGIVSYLLITK